MIHLTIVIGTAKLYQVVAKDKIYENIFCENAKLALVFTEKLGKQL